MAVSRVVMNFWCKKFRHRMEEIGLKVYLETVYVDDLRYIVSLLDLDTTWDEEDNCWSVAGMKQNRKRLIGNKKTEWSKNRENGL